MKKKYVVIAVTAVLITVFLFLLACLAAGDEEFESTAELIEMTVCIFGMITFFPSVPAFIVFFVKSRKQKKKIADYENKIRSLLYFGGGGHR